MHTQGYIRGKKSMQTNKEFGEQYQVDKIKF